MLAQIDPAKLKIIFLCKVVFGLWANTAQVIFFCSFGSGRSRQHHIYMIISLRKDDYVVQDKIAILIFLCPRQHLDNTDQSMDYGLKLGPQVIVFCNVEPSRPRQHSAGYFPAKTCLCTQGQYCRSNFLVQCCLIHIWTTQSI